jgi:hypothetical protein
MDRLRLRWSKQKAETRARNKTNRVVVPTDMSKEPFPWTWEQVGSPAFKRALAREIEAHLETLEPLFPRVYAGAYEDDGCYVCEDYAEESTAHRARLSTAGCPVVLCQECFDRWGEIFGIETLNIAEEALYYARLHQSYSPTTYSYVYRLFSIDNALLYVGKSNRVVKRFYSNGGHFDTKDWWNDVASASVSVYSSEIEALEAEAHAIYSEKPLHNKVVPHRYLSKAPRMLSKTFGSLV